MIDTPKRLSESRLWAINQRFYERAGPSAWSDQVVPTQITSNAMIANAYAQVITGYLRDVATARGADDTAPVTIVELGTGSGQFSYLLVRALEAAVAMHRGHAAVAPFRYVMTDVAMSNIAGWRTHPQLGPMLSQGAIDAAVLDGHRLGDAHSVLSGRPLSETWRDAPVILIANYLFDSLVCDAFHVEGGELYEVEVGLEADGTNADADLAPELFHTLRFTQQLVPTRADVYPEPDFNDVLTEYRTQLDRGTFLFPVGPLRLLRAIGAMAPKGVLTLVADKGNMSIRDYVDNRSIDICETGAFSSTVNFDAIARWTANNDGHAKLPVVANPRLDIVAFVQGKIGQYGETELAYRRSIEALGPHHLHWLVNAVLESPPDMTPRAMLSLLRASHFDPRVLLSLGDMFATKFEDAKPLERTALAVALVQCANNGFAFQGKDRLHWVIGKLFRRLGLAGRALECFEKAEAPVAELACESAMCHIQLGDREVALDVIRQALII